ncbi:uncharacterized protein LOC131155951 isoform X2 [Malania oleifera]|uniref:uncharacterized protein LOC131155951 isoform X2 n=1 Tax=Malania oleifera TaxID=397392 RepID=UPI0025AE817E|nr:uncharacterized protein LOC131155951 isoform X2 [Malania oleifera]
MTLSHFFKRLPYMIVSRFPLRHRRLIRRLPPPTRFLDLSSAFVGVRHQWRVVSVHVNTSTSSSSSFSSQPSLETTEPDSSSSYISVQIHCPKDVADMFSEALICFGASSTSMDEQDSNEATNKICISSIFSEGHDVNMCISDAADSIGLKEIPSYEVTMGEQFDWIKKTQDVQATNIILNPGFAFGTGDHPTTKLCLLLLKGLINGGEHFLDYGTGSGVLAIAALKFGAALSVGVDIDPQAITSARQNAALNNIGPEKMQLHLLPSNTSFPMIDAMTDEYMEGQSAHRMGVFSETEKYDVVIANILLNPLLDLGDDIVSYAKSGAVVGVSGILSEQLPYIVEHYSQFLEGMSVSQQDGWACVSGMKKKRNLTIS